MKEQPLICLGFIMFLSYQSGIEMRDAWNAAVSDYARFYRTKVELKSAICSAGISFLPGFYRTKVELKFLCVIAQRVA